MYVNKEKFFRDVSARANHVDLQSVRTIYYAILKTILIEVEKNEKVYLPNFGKFHLKEEKGRGAPGLNGGPTQRWKDRKIIKFSAGLRLKEYFKNKS